MVKKLIAAALIIFLSIFWGMSYHRANQSPFQVPTENYPKGSQVDIGMNFFDGTSENPVGYKLQVCSSAVKTYSEMLKELGQDNNAVPLIDEYGYPRPDYVYDVELKVNNDDNTDGYVVISRYMLVDRALVLEMDYALWGMLFPDAQGAAAIKLKPGTEMTIHIPFVPSARSTRLYKDSTNSRMKSDDFSLCISEYPVRKLLEIN